MYLLQRMAPINSWKTIFVTGGAGYIGSHCIVELLECGYDVIAIDNFANSVTEGKGESAALKRVEKITGKKVQFYNCDLLDKDKLEEVFNKVTPSNCPSYCIPLKKKKFFLAQNRLRHSFCRHQGCRRIYASSSSLLQE